MTVIPAPGLSAQTVRGAQKLVALVRAMGEEPVSDVYLADGTCIQPDGYTGHILVDAASARHLENSGWVAVTNLALTGARPPTGRILTSSVYSAKTNTISGLAVNASQAYGPAPSVPVAVFIDGATAPFATTTTAADGTWSVDVSSVPTGQHVFATSVAGNVPRGGAVFTR